MDNTAPGALQHTPGELHAFNQAVYDTAHVRMSDIDNPLVQSSIATLTTIPVSSRTSRPSTIPTDVILRDLRLSATTSLSALAGQPTTWRPNVFLEVTLHYRSHVVAKFTGLREDQIRRGVKHAAKVHGRQIGYTPKDVLVLHNEYKRRHAGYYTDPNTVKCCTARRGILNPRVGNKKAVPRAPQDVPQEMMDGMAGLGVVADSEQKHGEDDVGGDEALEF